MTDNEKGGGVQITSLWRQISSFCQAAIKSLDIPARGRLRTES